MRTIGSVLSDEKGFGSGFDFLRVALATSVVVWHEFYVVSGKSETALDQTPIAWLPGYGILVMFFSLSGFLITASALRLSVKNFLINRGLRIVPALSVEIILSAFILGPLFTSLSYSAYFTNIKTYDYFSNIVGLVNYFLPGVFVGRPAPEVNSSLWTVPFEYICYGLIIALISTRLLHRRLIILSAAAAFTAVGFVFYFTGYAAPSQTPLPTSDPYSQLEKIFATALFLGRGAKLLVAFLLGIAAYLYRDRLIYDRRLFAAAVALCLIVAVLGPAPWLTGSLLNAVICPTLVYITVFIGVSNLPRLPVFSRGDYSYGIYLYGFPIQQAASTLWPSAPLPILLVVSMLSITAFAAFSWHVIEKPILRLRGAFSFVARRRLEEGASTSATSYGQTPSGVDAPKREHAAKLNRNAKDLQDADWPPPSRLPATRLDFTGQ
jgi:peptidoglycan/LPS O-acetylase OafA/YrhL